MVAGADHSKRACYVHALQHQPDGVVAGTAYSEEARYEQLLQHQPNDTIARINLGVEGGGVSMALQHKAATRILGTISAPGAAASSLGPPTAQKHATNRH